MEMVHFTMQETASLKTFTSVNNVVMDADQINSDHSGAHQKYTVLGCGYVNPEPSRHRP